MHVHIQYIRACSFLYFVYYNVKIVICKNLQIIFEKKINDKLKYIISIVR